MNRLINTNNFLHNPVNNKKSLLFNSRYDEPTYLTIRIDFFPEYTDRKTSEDLSDFNALKYNDMSQMSYNYMPHPLLDPNGAYSTYAYLKNDIGDEYRANLVQTLIKGLADLTWECPYYITSISGLNELLTVNYKRGSRISQDAVITLNCIEGLDQRITAIKNLYKKIAWDDVYQRWILPDMMRFFRMNIYISEFRIFHKPDNLNIITNSQKNKLFGNTELSIPEKIKKEINSTNGSNINFIDIVDNMELNKNIPTMCLECYMCEFDIQDSFSHLSELTTNPKDNMLSNLQIKIKVGNIVEKSTYNLFGFGKDKELLGYLRLDDEYLSDFIKYRNSLRNNENPLQKDSSTVDYYLRTGINADILLDNSDILSDIREKTKLKLYQDVLKSAAEYSEYDNPERKSYISRLLKNTAKNALSWVKNAVKDEINKLLNNNITASLSINDIRNAIRSENVFAVYNILKTNLISTEELYPEVSAATNHNLSFEMFKDTLEKLSSSTATDDTHVLFKNISKHLLDYGNEINATSIDEYMAMLKSIVDDMNYSTATQHNKVSTQLNMESNTEHIKNIAL